MNDETALGIALAALGRLTDEAQRNGASTIYGYALGDVTLAYQRLVELRAVLYSIAACSENDDVPFGLHLCVEAAKRSLR